MKRPSAWPAIAVVAAASALLLLLPPAAGLATPSGVASTRVVVFHPWGVRGSPLRGSCWTSSSAAWRPDAWRCLAGNQILDPCFSASPRARTVICQVLRPFTGRGVRLTLTKPLPLAERGAWPRVPHAWIVQIPGGATCAFFESMPPPMANRHATPPSYGCSDGSYLGTPHPGHRWRATHLRLRSTPHGFVVARRSAIWILTAWE
jgi:hypothetical protein